MYNSFTKNKYIKDSIMGKCKKVSYNIMTLMGTMVERLDPTIKIFAHQIN
jgi:hypothetical protein